MSKIKSNFIFLFFALALSHSAWAQTRSTNIQVQEGRKFYIHKIEKGQSLYAISKLYAVSVDDLFDLNPDLKAGAKAGQEIRIPFSTSAPTVTVQSGQPDTSRYLTHKITKGETIYSICRKYNISERQLAVYNPSLSQGLKEDQWIVVGEKQKNKPAPAKTPTAVKTKTTAVIATDSTALKPISKPKKSEYNVALALPFRLESTLGMDVNTMLRSSTGFPSLPALAIDFYMGFKLAADSLSATDFSVHLDLYDIDDKDSTGLQQFSSGPKFKDLDFIFGPLYANGFKSVSKKAKEFHIPIVSPITTQNKILFNNAYISKANPSQFTLLEGLADYCLDSIYTDKCNVILVAAGEKDKKDINFVSAFRKYFGERQKNSPKSAKDSLRVVKGIEGVKAAYLPNVRNIIVNLSSNQVLISDFITQLALFKKDKDIVLCGWENNSSNDNIDQEYLNDLNYTFPHPFNLIDSTHSKQLVEYYMNRQGTRPGDYFYLGFHVAYYYLKHLKTEGPEFIHHLDQYPDENGHMRFSFYRPDLTTGYDNRGLYVYRYSNYKLIKTGWK